MLLPQSRVERERERERGARFFAFSANSNIEQDKTHIERNESVPLTSVR